MITKKSELTAQLLRFIGENWVTGREAACGVIDEMMEQAAERSVTELIAFFNDHYPLEIPENHAMLWQGAFLMKAFTVWDNPEQELKKYLDEFERKLEQMDGSRQSMVCHADELSFEEQAGLFAGIELSGNRISKDFYNRVCRCYPDLDDFSIIYMAGCIQYKQYKDAYQVVKKLENKYPDDFELLKGRLSIYGRVGTKEEVHKAAAETLAYQKKYNTYTGWVTLNYAGNVQIEREDMEGAYETFRHLINDWSRLSLKEEEGCMHVASVFVNILQLPSRMLEDDISLIAVQFCMYQQAMERAGVDFNTDFYNNIITTFVVEMSKKLGNRAFRPAFSLLLESLTERPKLGSRRYKETFESGYRALESYRLNEDEQIPGDIRYLCLSLYSDGQSGEVMPYDEKYLLYEYVTADASRKNYFRDQYPCLYPKLQKMLQLVSKKGMPEDRTTAPKIKTVVKSEKKVGRNDPCPCGSGKKYKKCCGK